MDETWFPFLGNKPTGDELSGGPKVPAAGWSRKKPNWATRRERQDSLPTEPTSNRPRLIVFIVGGVSPNEIVAAQKLQEEYNVEIVIGSTLIWTPDSFIEGLKVLGNRGDESFYGFKRPLKTRRQIQEMKERPARTTSKPDVQEEKSFFKKTFFRSDANSEQSSHSNERVGDSRRHGGSRELNSNSSSSGRERERKSSREGDSRMDRVRKEATPVTKEKKGWFFK